MIEMIFKELSYLSKKLDLPTPASPVKITIINILLLITIINTFIEVVIMFSIISMGPVMLLPEFLIRVFAVALLV